MCVLTAGSTFGGAGQKGMTACLSACRQILTVSSIKKEVLVENGIPLPLSCTLSPLKLLVGVVRVGLYEVTAHPRTRERERWRERRERRESTATSNAGTGVVSRACVPGLWESCVAACQWTHLIKAVMIAM